MSKIRPGVVALILALTMVTSGVTAVQNVGGEESVVDASVDAVLETQKSLQGDTNTETKQSGLSANLQSSSGEKAQCAQGELLSKYNYDTESGKWVYEKGPAGDVFTITTEKSDEDGPIQISWESSGPSVTYLEAQYDGLVYTKDYDPPNTSDTLPEQDFAYSNVVLCGKITFQVDLIKGTPRDKLESNDDLYRPDDRLDTSAFISSEGDVYKQRTMKNDLECIENVQSIQVDTGTDPSTASITFDVAKGCDITVTLAAYDLQGSSQDFTLPQKLADKHTKKVDGKKTVTLTVELKDTDLEKYE